VPGLRRAHGGPRHTAVGEDLRAGLPPGLRGARVSAPGVEAGGADTLIPNSALKTAIGTWCACSGRAVPSCTDIWCPPTSSFLCCCWPRRSA
jgi:hypothetical protein